MIKRIAEAWESFKRNHIVDDISNHWGEDCFKCNKGNCNPAYCRSIGLRVDK